jgi:hypothetical protein
MPETLTSAEVTLTGTPENTKSSPSVVPPTPKSAENTLIETAEYTGVIISDVGASKFSYLFDESSNEFWEPSIDDVSSTEKCIRQYLVSVEQEPKLDAYQKEKVAFILENLAQYRRQYVGIVVDGKRRIWVNSFFVDDSFPNWDRVPVDVEDGGRYFWQIEYLLLEDDCINFYVHGEA